MSSRFVRAAIREYQDAYDYHFDQDPRLAEEFADAIEDGIAKIEGAPDRWAEIEPGFRRYLVLRFKYSIIYRIRPDHVQIVAVAHTARRPGYWHGRVRR